MDNKTEQAEQLQKELLKLKLERLCLKTAIKEVAVGNEKFIDNNVFEDYFSDMGDHSPKIKWSLLVAIEKDLKEQLQRVQSEIKKIMDKAEQLQNELLND